MFFCNFFCIFCVKVFTNFTSKMAIDKIELRVLIRYCWRRGLSTRDTAKEICNAEGNGTVSYKTAERWFKRFDEGNFDLEDKPRSGRPTKLDDSDLQAELDIEPSSSTRDLAKELGVHQTTVLRHTSLTLCTRSHAKIHMN